MAALVDDALGVVAVGEARRRVGAAAGGAVKAAGPRRVRAQGPRGPVAERAGLAGLAVGALGVVFGDIGTSPLYTVEAIFSAAGVEPTAANVRGVFSLVVWALTLVVSVKYVAFVMRADNDGDGGIMALIARVEHLTRASGRARGVLVLVGVAGVSLFVGDGMITPAISVLASVEGLELVAPQVKGLVGAIALVILVALFAAQRFGSGAVSRLFGPIMLVWFGALALTGVVQLVAAPGILASVSPTYAVAFVLGHPLVAFTALAGVVLAVTGAEALYADMGHFGRSAIRRAWFAIAFPALALNYLGQGSLLLESPANRSDPFYLLFPAWSRAPAVALATIATVIASQAVISGMFSLARQAMRLGFLPRLHIEHTSEREIGQVYVPAVNAVLFAGVLTIVVGFGASARLASAYGLAVTGTFLATSVLFLTVARGALGWSARRTAGVAALLLPVDVAFLAANLPKLPSGGWLPLAIASAAFAVLSTWHRGRAIVLRNRAAQLGSLTGYVDELHTLALQRTPGTAVFLDADPHSTPLALHTHVAHGRSLQRSVILLSVVTEPRPHVAAGKRVEIRPLGQLEDGLLQVIVRAGYKDRLDVPASLRLAAARGLGVDVGDPSYYVSRSVLTATSDPGLRRWRKRLFMALTRLAADPVAYFGLPDDRVVILGSRVRL